MQQDLEYLCDILCSHEFRRFKNVFYKTQASGIVCIVHFEAVKDKKCLSYILEFALESLYSELPEYPYSNMGCITRYPVINLFEAQSATFIRSAKEPDDKGEHRWNRAVVPPREQIEVMREQLFPLLDRIQTQEQLVQAMTEMEILRDGKEDPLAIEKYSPLLYMQRYQEAGTIIQNWLKKLGIPEEAWRSNAFMEEYARSSFQNLDTKYDGFDKRLLVKTAEKRLKALQHIQYLLQLAENSDDEDAIAYLRKNYTTNVTYLQFIEGSH